MSAESAGSGWDMGCGHFDAFADPTHDCSTWDEAQSVICGPHEPDHVNPHQWDAETCPPLSLPPDQTPPGTKVTCPNGALCTTYGDCAAAGCRQASSGPTSGE